METISPLRHALFLAISCAIWFGFYLYSDRFIDLLPGLIICGSDCTDFNNLSDYFLREGEFSPVGGDFHTTPFYWLYILLISAIKWVFGDFWKPAYAALMALALYGFALIALRLGQGRTRKATIFLPILLLLTYGNISLITYGRTLLTDFGFALIAASFFMMVARGWSERRLNLIFLALALALLASFFRPNSLFLLCLGITAVLLRLFPGMWKKPAFFITAMTAAGLSVWVFSASMSVFAAQNLEAVEEGSIPAAGIFGQFLEFNYTGDDHVSHESRKGALISNTPYRSWYMNDGSFTGMMVTFTRRIPAIFEIWTPTFSRANNLYRSAFYGVLYFGVIGFLFSIFWKNKNERREVIAYSSLILGYLLIFVAMSHVTIRFRLVFDVAFSLAATTFYTDMYQRYISVPLGKIHYTQHKS